MAEAHLTVLTVTYGSRSDVVSRTIESALAHPGARVLVVSNGSSSETRDKLGHYVRAHPDRVIRVDFERNIGSAPAFAEGLRVAYGLGDPVLILDDDNPIDPKTVKSLLALADEVERSAATPFALVVHRPVNSAQRSIVAGARVSDVFRELTPGAFHGFDLFTRVGARDGDDALTDEVLKWRIGAQVLTTHRIPVTMWGGVFLPADAVHLRALPLEELVLYGDDNDFSRAFRRSGGRFHLVDGLTIVDSEAWRPPDLSIRTWRSRFPATFRTAPESTWRLQYLFRNQAYLSRTQTQGSRAASAKLVVNAVVRMTGVIVLGSLSGRPGLAWKLTAASIAGLRGRLGETYPLPQ